MTETQLTETVRDLNAADLDWLLALNTASVPHVSALERNELEHILDMAGYARTSLQDGAPAGALIALWPGTDYASANYRWFDERHADFLYIDRIMIDAAARKGGHGRRLYDDIADFASTQGASTLACEVNSQPPNPISMRFHQALGFEAVGELANDDRSKSVVLMMKTL